MEASLPGRYHLPHLEPVPWRRVTPIFGRDIRECVRCSSSSRKIYLTTSIQGANTPNLLCQGCLWSCSIANERIQLGEIMENSVINCTRLNYIVVLLQCVNSHPFLFARGRTDKTFLIMHTCCGKICLIHTLLTCLQKPATFENAVIPKSS